MDRTLQKLAFAASALVASTVGLMGNVTRNANDNSWTFGFATVSAQTLAPIAPIVHTVTGGTPGVIAPFGSNCAGICGGPSGVPVTSETPGTVIDLEPCCGEAGDIVRPTEEYDPTAVNALSMANAAAALTNLANPASDKEDSTAVSGDTRILTMLQQVYGNEHRFNISQIENPASLLASEGEGRYIANAQFRTRVLEKAAVGFALGAVVGDASGSTGQIAAAILAGYQASNTLNVVGGLVPDFGRYRQRDFNTLNELEPGEYTVAPNGVVIWISRAIDRTQPGFHMAGTHEGLAEFDDRFMRDRRNGDVPLGENLDLRAHTIGNDLIVISASPNTPDHRSNRVFARFGTVATPAAPAPAAETEPLGAPLDPTESAPTTSIAINWLEVLGETGFETPANCIGRHDRRQVARFFVNNSETPYASAELQNRPGVHDTGMHIVWGDAAGKKTGHATEISIDNATGDVIVVSGGKYIPTVGTDGEKINLEQLVRQHQKALNGVPDIENRASRCPVAEAAPAAEVEAAALDAPVTTPAATPAAGAAAGAAQTQATAATTTATTASTATAPATCPAAATTDNRMTCGEVATLVKQLRGELATLVVGMAGVAGLGLGLGLGGIMLAPRRPRETPAENPADETPVAP